MTEIARQLAAADSVEEIRAIMDGANPADLAELGDLARQALRPATDYKIPGPYDIAMAFGAAALASGTFGNNVGAAMAAGWMAIPEFYLSRDAYVRDVAPIFFPNPEGTPNGEPSNGV